MSDNERDKRKAVLLSQIHLQRLDLSIAKRNWLKVTAPYDSGWHALVSLRRYIVIVGSVLAVWNVRRPGKIMRLAKRGFSVWSTWRVARTSLSKIFFHQQKHR